MKVVLLYPEVYDMARFKDKRKEFPPFGVLYLAAVTEEAGHEVAIEAVTPGRTCLDLTGYDAIGFSLASSATYGLMLQARHESAFATGALVMVGGVHCNFYPESSLADFDAAVAAYGESEETVLEILSRVGSRDFTGIPGILWRERDGQLHRSPPRPLIRDIDQLPLPARHLLPAGHVIMADRLAGTDLRMAHVMFSRGCPFPCSFCAAGQTRIQYRSGKSARIELEHLIDAYGIQGFAIVDDNFIVNKPKVGDICDHIKGLSLCWSALSRVDTVNPPLLAKMAASGCIEVKYGMESGSETLLKAMRKNTTRNKIRAAIHATTDAGIAAKVFVIHGFPGENDQTTDETISLLAELAPSIARVSLFRFVPLPGTQVYENPDQYGIMGTHLQPGWDGDWSAFHIHHNTRRWWGTDAQWAEVESSYQRLRGFVETTWGPQSLSLSSQNPGNRTVLLANLRRWPR
jgi:anaerobic magnesium-protoporphyrin IX monomethyl ester cyclase